MSKFTTKGPDIFMLGFFYGLFGAHLFILIESPSNTVSKIILFALQTPYVVDLFYESPHDRDAFWTSAAIAVLAYIQIAPLGRNPRKCWLFLFEVIMPHIYLALEQGVYSISPSIAFWWETLFFRQLDPLYTILSVTKECEAYPQKPWFFRWRPFLICWSPVFIRWEYGFMVGFGMSTLLWKTIWLALDRILAASRHRRTWNTFMLVNPPRPKVTREEIEQQFALISESEMPVVELVEDE